MNFIGNRNFRAGPQTSLEGFICHQNSDKQQKIKVFDRLFEEAEIAKFTPQELREYEASKMAYRDITNSIDTAKREGRIEANIETAQRLLAMGLSTEQVAKATQLPLDMVQNLSN